MPVTFVPQIQYLLDQLYVDLHDNFLNFSETRISYVIPLPTAKSDINLQE